MRKGGGGKQGSPCERIGVSEASIMHKESVMQCTVSPTPRATPARTPWAVSPRSLAAAFAHIPDPRRARSVTYALPALLALAVAAILSNHLSVLAIAEWGARQSPDLLRTLGFARAHALPIDPAAPVQQARRPRPRGRAERALRPRRRPRSCSRRGRRHG